MFVHHLSLFYIAVAEQLIAQHSAIKMLYSRVKLILEYIKAVEAGNVENVEPGFRCFC